VDGGVGRQESRGAVDEQKGGHGGPHFLQRTQALS